MLLPPARSALPEARPEAASSTWRRLGPGRRRTALAPRQVGRSVMARRRAPVGGTCVWTYSSPG